MNPNTYAEFTPAKRRSAMTGVVALCLASFIVSNSRPVMSQAVELVRVEVSVVSEGYRVSKLTGHRVVNDRDENVGHIDDIVIGRDDRSLFAVLEVGGFLGFGEHLVAVPYQSLQIQDGLKKIVLPGASEEALKELAKFSYGS